MYSKLKTQKKEKRESSLCNSNTRIDTQIIRADRFVAITLSDFPEVEEGLKIYLAWNENQYNGIPRNCYLITPSCDQQHIIISLRDKGCGWLRVNLEPSNVITIPLRLSTSPEYEYELPVEKMEKVITVRFQIWYRNDKSTTQVGEANINARLMCTKCKTNVLRGEIKSAENLGLESFRPELERNEDSNNSSSNGQASHCSVSHPEISPCKKRKVEIQESADWPTYLVKNSIDLPANLSWPDTVEETITNFFQ